MFKIATWNVNSLRVRIEHVLDWLQTHQPDVLALQETKTTDDAFPVDAFAEAGYYAVFSGQKTYNGVATLSKQPLLTVATELDGFTDPQKRVLCTTLDKLCILNLYVPNGSEVGSDKYAYKLDWLDHLHRYTQKLLQQFPQCVLLGDFNIAPADADVYDPVAWHGKILCSDAERKAFFDLIDAGLSDCFRQFDQQGNPFTWWDYRAAGFRRNLGLRIDHILASTELAKHCKNCAIDITPRKLERPSDHTPVIAEFTL